MNKLLVGVCLLILCIGCTKNHGPSTTFSIGQNYGGGIIFYLDSSKRHGLICAESDQSSGGIPWWNGTDTNTFANGIVIGTGLANTNAIVNIQGQGIYAASVCKQLQLNGYSDWYLPSKNELNELYIQKAAGKISGFSNIGYWSSTQASGYAITPGTNPYFLAWYEDFTNGGQDILDRNIYSIHVRAIRSF